MSRRDGSFAFSGATAHRQDAELLAAAVNIKPRPVVARDFGRDHRSRLDAKLPKAAIHSEWAATAVMRPDWSRSAPRLTVLYPGTSCRVELACGKDVLWSGEWGLEVAVNGVPARATSDWSQLCWLSDDDVDYLELEIELGEDLRVQRHLLLAREDRFLFLADAVLGSRQAALRYCGTLPLCPGVAFREACETREGTLAGRKPRAVVLPLALPEWLADRRGGELQQTAAGLELRQSAEGRSLFAPLFFDLNRHRMTRPATWRQLTVAESWANQPNDVAVGYRVAIGRRQWLLYRSLTPPRNRTLLGHNLSTETLIARFGRDGQIEPLIEIE